MEMDEWLMDDNNLDRWECGKLTAGDRRVLMTHWMGKATEKVFAKRNTYKYFQHTGALVTADATDDNKINLQGLNGAPYSSMDAPLPAGWQPPGAEPALREEVIEEPEVRVRIPIAMMMTTLVLLWSMCNVRRLHKAIWCRRVGCR